MQIAQIMLYFQWLRKIQWTIDWMVDMWTLFRKIIMTILLHWFCKFVLYLPTKEDVEHFYDRRRIRPDLLEKEEEQSMAKSQVKKKKKRTKSRGENNESSVKTRSLEKEDSKPFKRKGTTRFGGDALGRDVGRGDFSVDMGDIEMYTIREDQKEPLLGEEDHHEEEELTAAGLQAYGNSFKGAALLQDDDQKVSGIIMPLSGIIIG